MLPIALAALQFTNYQVLFEAAPVTGAAVIRDRQALSLAFTGFKEDDEAGGKTYFASSRDMGRHWTPPLLFGQELKPDIIKNPEQEFLWLALFGPTAKGTSLSLGYHLAQGARTEDKKQYEEDSKWRTSTLVIGRSRKPAGPFEYRKYPSGTFLGEQFPAPGLITPSGRIVVTLWGAKGKGENWRCGVLLSDDDGRTWRYRDVAYEADSGIRDKQDVPAGFNEQTLFQTKGGRMISIIRGREALGRVPGSSRDTFYFRSESNDEGETWSRPEPTNMAGTGAPSAGLVLPDGSLLTASRVPYSRTLYSLPEKDLFGLLFFRSNDEGRTWNQEHIFQRDPGGAVFDNHYNAMNGQFLRIGPNEWMYLFAQFSVKTKVHRLLSVRIRLVP